MFGVYPDIVNTRFNPRLIFNADETMTSSKRFYKAVTEHENMHTITNGLPPFQDMSAMITINASGESVPPMIILSNLQTVPRLARVRARSLVGKQSQWMDEPAWSDSISLIKKTISLTDRKHGDGGG